MVHETQSLLETRFGTQSLIETRRLLLEWPGKQRFFSFPPNNGEIVFLQSGNYIVLCNMRTMELKIERKLQNMPCILSSYFTKFVLLLSQPSWPTPIPPLPLKFGG